MMQRYCMSELLKERMRNSIGKVVTIYLINGWRYEGKLTNSDDTYIEILDFKTNSYRIIQFVNIKDCEVRQ